jgi:hypothetical protein
MQIHKSNRIWVWRQINQLINPSYLQILCGSERNLFNFDILCVSLATSRRVEKLFQLLQVPGHTSAQDNKKLNLIILQN